MNAPTRATVSAAAAALVAGAGFLGTRYLAAAVLGLIVALALGWPGLLRASRKRQASVILVGGGAMALASVVLARTEPYLRHMVIALGAMVVAALVSEVFFESSRGRTVTSVAATAAGAVVVASGASWVAASRTVGAEHLVVVAGAALAIAAVGAALTPYAQLNTALALVLATGVGAGIGELFAELSWWSGGATGLLCGVIVTLLTELGRREPRPPGVWAGIASAVAPVLSAGALVYIAGRMLVG
ncbi:hypothetical protein [Demequina pelophila]|uniref:hypothetical protein n=1 Tax=Demequina pelophila TaxID=1638984 RepID=UPI000780A73A|nr:hypothetical protein [Demequina pelophila]